MGKQFIVDIYIYIKKELLIK